MKEHGWGRPKTPKIIRILTCTPAHRRSQVMQTYEHMNIPRSKAERDRHALNAQRRRVRVRPIARSSSRALRRCAQLAQRPETRRYRRWRPPVQASSTAPVNGVACGNWDASWGQGRARQRSAHLAAELSCQLAPAKSQTAIGRTCPSWRRHRHNPGHDHTTTGKVSTGAGIATAAPSRAIAPPILRAPPSVQPPKPRPSSEWAARTGGAAHQLTPFLCARLENKSFIKA